ncbi:hypothetical protein L6R53_09770 [Myxococcota bacterium]|nr:hypothetical protein [Myxococcota bacterium]
MSTEPSLAEKQGSLRFVTIWTVVNALLVLLGAARVATAGPGTAPQVTLGVLGVIAVMVVVGVVRIQKLRAEIAQAPRG